MGTRKLCIQDLAQWIPQLHEQLLTVLDATSLSDMDKPVHDSEILADQMLNGVDQDDHGEVEPAPGRCGVLTAYQYAYYMADMPLLPVNPLDTPTATSTPSPTATGPTFIIRPTNTATRSPNTSNTPIPSTNNPPTNPPSNPTDPPKQSHGSSG